MRARASSMCVAALALLCAGSCNAPRKVRLPEWDASRVAGVQQEIERYFAANDAGPVSVAILRGDTLVLVGAVGDSIGAWANAPIALGELERQVLAAAALVQVDAGRIALDEPLPLRLANESVTAPTLRELLHQVSGLASRDSIGAWVAEHRPREYWSESRVHYDAVAEVLAARIGRPPIELLADAWTRAGLTMQEPLAGGRLRATVADLARWARALEQGAVVSPARYSEMTRLLALRDAREWPYGMGLELQTFEGRAKVMHAGSSELSTVALARYPQDDLSIAIAVSAPDAWALPALERRIARRIFGAPDPAPPAVPIKAGDLERSQGGFTCGALEFELRAQDERLHLTVRTTERGSAPVELDRVALTHIGAGRFIGADEPDAVHVWIKRGAGPTPEAVIGWFGLPCQAVRREVAPAPR